MLTNVFGVSLDQTTEEEKNSCVYFTKDNTLKGRIWSSTKSHLWSKIINQNMNACSIHP